MLESNTVLGKKHETEHIVAILDLLGASEMIASDRSETILNVISQMFRKAASDWLYVQNAPAILHDVKCVTFSDNIAFALNLALLPDKEDAIKSFIKYISVFQGAALKNGLLFRGGISLGRLYMDTETNFVWGKALVDAHVLEEKTAIYPRVVLSRQFEKFDLSNIDRVRQDYDGIYFVDYVSTINKLYPDWIDKNKVLIEAQYASREGKPGQEKILQKYGWLRHYIEQCETECLAAKI